MQEKICPYPGLRPFNEEESIFFKGREEQVQRIVKRLGENKFLMLNGASGDGKSSLMFAGVIPYAKAGFFNAEFDNWLVVNFRPERKPLSNLTEALCKQLQLPDKVKVEKELGYGFSALIDIYKASPFYFDESGDVSKQANSEEKKNQKRKAANLLILVDQFEEFFTNAENYLNGTPSNESQKTVNVLLESYKIALAQSLPVYVVCTMRSDYIGQCAAFRGLPEAIGYSQFFVPRLKRQELEQVIEGPAALSGCKINKSLVQTLLNAAGEGFDQLPILQHALNSIWKLADNGNVQLEKIHLAMVGGIAPTALPAEERIAFEAWFNKLPEYKKVLLAKPSLNNVLNAHANELMEFLPEHYSALTGKNLSKEKIEHILKISFQCLTAIDSGRAVRRRTTLTEITNIINDDKITVNDVNAVLQIFREQGNTFLQPFVEADKLETQNLQPETVLDITHESLIRNWTVLNDWAQDENENYTVWLEIEKQLNRWLNNQESANFLLAQGPLSYFEEWQSRFNPNKFWLLKYDDTKIERSEKLKLAGEKINALDKFLVQSNKAIKRKRNFLIYAVSAAFVVLGLFTGWALKERGRALTQEKLAIEKNIEAEKSRQQALSAKELAEKEKQRAEELGRIAESEKLKALNSKDAAEKAKHEALAAKAIAEQEKIKAEQQTLLATNEKQKAEAQRKIADDAKDKAISAEQKARQLTLTSLAQNLAFKSTEIDFTDGLQELVALQAYNFMVQNNQNVQDPYIYEGLRNAESFRRGYKIYIGTSLGFEPRTIAFNSTNAEITLAGKEGNIRILAFSEKTSSVIRSLDLPDEGIITSVLLSSDAKKILCGYADNTIIVWDIANIKHPIKQVLYTGNQLLRYASFSASGSHLAIVNDTATINLWKLNDNQILKQAGIQQTRRIKSIVLSENGDRVFWSLNNGEINFAETANSIVKNIYPAQKKDIAVCMAFSKQKNLLGGSFTNGEIFSIDLNNKNVTTMDEKHSRVENVIFNPSGTLLASSSVDKTIRVFDLQRKNSKAILLRNLGSKIRCFVFANDHQLIAGLESDQFYFWELSSDEIAKTLSSRIVRNMTQDEWVKYIGNEIDYQKTCPSLK